MKLVERIHGPDGSIYLRRIKLTPSTPWGQLLFHTFFRGDMDADPHDHPWDFTTFPLNSYAELVGPATIQVVKRFRFHHRYAGHTHRVLHATDFRVPFYTLVWRGPYRRTWGFWRDWKEFVPYWEYLGLKPPARLGPSDKTRKVKES